MNDEAAQATFGSIEGMEDVVGLDIDRDKKDEVFE